MPNRDRQSLEDMLLAASHSYDQIDDDELWQVIQRDLPDLITRLESILSQTS
jgi:uncharacterized protein with HEPN domain